MQIAGHCGKCGAPYWTESAWWGVGAPPISTRCGCWNIPQSVTITTTTGSNFTFYSDTSSAENTDEIGEISIGKLER